MNMQHSSEMLGGGRVGGIDSHGSSQTGKISDILGTDPSGGGRRREMTFEKQRAKFKEGQSGPVKAPVHIYLLPHLFMVSRQQAPCRSSICA